MKNIHILPTDKPSNITIRTKTNELMYSYKLFSSKNGKDINVNQHIYITSDEEIKEGDWCILLENHYVNGGIGKYNTKKAIGYGLHNTEFFKKIILTTDQDLIKDGVQAIDDKFLEWFVNNPSCEEVMIETFMNREYEWGDDGSSGHTNFYMRQRYKIIIPKEEPKQHVELINDNIEEFDKAIKLFKQETLEESAERISKTHSVYETGQDDFYQGFIAGAEWQAKRMYSEEEVVELLQKALTHQDDEETGSLVTVQGEIRPANFFSWFERFKKK